MVQMQSNKMMMPLFTQSRNVHVDGMVICVVHLRPVSNVRQFNFLMLLDQEMEAIGGTIEVVSASEFSERDQLGHRMMEPSDPCTSYPRPLKKDQMQCRSWLIFNAKKRRMFLTDPTEVSERKTAESESQGFHIAYLKPTNLSRPSNMAAALFLPHIPSTTSKIYYNNKDEKVSESRSRPGRTLGHRCPTPAATLIEYFSGSCTSASRATVHYSDEIPTPRVDEHAVRTFLERSYPKDYVRDAEIDVIKQGGQGVIVRVKVKDDFIVVKIIHESETAIRHSMLESTLIIQSCLAALSNKLNIIPIHDFQFQPKIGHFLLMDYAQGSSLFELLCSEMLEDDMKDLIAQDLIVQVDKLHEYGVCHRDIAPKNIMVLCTGEVTLIDFDMCCCFNDNLTSAVGVDRLPLETRQKMCNRIVGTRRYMAPELEAGTRYTIDVDWYSVGATIAAMNPENEDWIDCAQELMSYVQQPQRRRLALKQHPCVGRGMRRSDTRKRLAEVAMATRLLMDSNRGALDN